MSVVLCQAHTRAAAQSDTESSKLAEFDRQVELGRREQARGHAAAAIEHFKLARCAADSAHNLSEKASALVSIGGSQIWLFRYREALVSLNAAQSVATAIHNDKLAGIAASNRATIYDQLGDELPARQNAQEAVSFLERSDDQRFLLHALANLGKIEFHAGLPDRAREDLRRAAAIAHASGSKALEAVSEEYLGDVFLENKDFVHASEALQHAQTLRLELKDNEDLPVTTWYLAKLAYEQGQYQTALLRLTQAVRAGTGRLATLPEYWSDDLRGQILLGLGRKDEALISFSKAVDETDAWRQQALPGDLTSIRTAAAIDSVYRNFIELAASLSLERHDARLARRAWSALAASRAAGLRDQMIASLDRRMELPPRYFELLTQLQTSEASLALGADPKQKQSLAESLQRTRGELADLENKIGISQTGPTAHGNKTIPATLLTSVQRSLEPDQVLLSFSLGKTRSFLWAVAKTQFQLYRLPPEQTLNSHAAGYFHALQSGATGPDAAWLSQQLLQPLDRLFGSKKEWLIAADGALLNQVPFAALPLPDCPAPVETVSSKHSVRFLPSELLLLSQPQHQPAQRFLGIADPIYNGADARLAPRFIKVSAGRVSPSITLARLAGSSTEIRSAAKLSGISDIQLLTGQDARQDKIREALTITPSVLHFAVHVIAASNDVKNESEAALALSLTPNGVPELVTKEAIAGLRVPGTLVVLSGCASQKGQVVPGAGLIGLGRAWLLAGAAAVVVTSWPVPDDAGDFFSDFYGRLRASGSRSGNLAERASAALQETQLDMQRSVGYRSSPSFWAAYSIISEE